MPILRNHDILAVNPNAQYPECEQYRVFCYEIGNDELFRGTFDECISWVQTQIPTLENMRPYNGPMGIFTE